MKTNFAAFTSVLAISALAACTTNDDPDPDDTALIGDVSVVLDHQSTFNLDPNSFSPDTRIVRTESISLSAGGYIRLAFEVDQLPGSSPTQEFPTMVTLSLADATSFLAVDDQSEDSALLTFTNYADVAAHIVRSDQTLCGERVAVGLDVPVADDDGTVATMAVGITRVLPDIDWDAGGDGGCPITPINDNCTPSNECETFFFVTVKGFCATAIPPLICVCYPNPF